jgi:hypothetical protein
LKKKLKFSAILILSNNLTSQILKYTLINDKNKKFVSENKDIKGNDSDRMDTDQKKDKIKLIKKENR